MTNDTLALSAQLRARAREIYETRRQGLYVTADRTFLVLLAGQWVAPFALSLPSFHWQSVPGPGPGRGSGRRCCSAQRSAESPLR